jgi:hypothetical protein
MQRCRFIFQIDSRTSYRYISDYDRTFDDKRRCHCVSRQTWCRSTSPCDQRRTPDSRTFSFVGVKASVATCRRSISSWPTPYSGFQNVSSRGSQGVSHLSSLNIIMANAVLQIPECSQSWESRRQTSDRLGINVNTGLD